jgi:sirohydrochlorin ferrochelatase
MIALLNTFLGLCAGPYTPTGSGTNLLRPNWREEADPTMPIILVDNGSRRPASTLALRAAAASLSDALGGRDVLAASIAHSDAVPASKLNDIPAQTLNTTIANLASSYGTIGGNVGAVIQPLYLGPSDGLKNGIEACAAALPNGYSLRIGGCLVDEKAAPSDNRVARALASNVLRVARREKLQPPLKVVVCDHGTPSPEVNAVRNKLAIDVQALLGEERADVAAASMERREGEEYDFNEPLLERCLGAQAPYDAGDVIVAMAFVLPGRHAGEGGDVAQIIEDAQKRASDELRVHVTPTLSTHSNVIKVLADRALRAEAGWPRVVQTGRLLK